MHTHVSVLSAEGVKVSYAYPGYGVEGLWEYVIAGLIPSASLLQFLFVRETKQKPELVC